jgi:hypothetical protein
VGCGQWRQRGSIQRRWAQAKRRSGAAGLMFVGSEIAAVFSGYREKSSGAEVSKRDCVWLACEHRERGKQREKEEEEKEERAEGGKNFHVQLWGQITNHVLTPAFFLKK